MTSVETSRKDRTEKMKRKLGYIVDNLLGRFEEKSIYFEKERREEGATLVRYTGYDTIVIHIRVNEDVSGKPKYEAVMEYIVWGEKIRNKKELEEWLNKKPMKMERTDLSMEIKWSVEIEPLTEIKIKEILGFLNRLSGVLRDDVYEEIYVSSGLNEKGIKEWEKVPIEKRVRLIQFILKRYRGEIYVRLRPSEKEIKELEEWMKLLTDERVKLYEERIKFILNPVYRKVIVNIQTHDPARLINLLYDFVNFLVS